ncbi:hypothetical protein MYCTH_49795 [Thermothelomyces thermophilus ATCC 42464]|uniref:Uncharacterized protein n=1 Tax=Thermothelomyces thermophilus (strain ATCC 42464 / BCRC 31852 / DSM 1799) TaxID=573729 RepID=G2QDA9_THET4|nr:uncharacterized protein MYCTH_49795 [Thermothelomyces thermophilus ATCC 42464]AEO57475.1 hypothetical protein MYCTH_49795 [Thermothelomyces thermophilus ATCC 42464]
MRSTDWATPLAAAPSAVGTMAILLKTASSDAAAGLPVKSRDVVGDRGEVVSQLPYDLLHSNLQSCSDIGRSAFTEGRSTMDYVHKAAISIIRNGGKVESILEMLENIEDARVNLKPEMQSVKRTAEISLERVRSLTENFQYWYWMICCLKNNVLESRGDRTPPPPPFFSPSPSKRSRQELPPSNANKVCFPAGTVQAKSSRQLSDLKEQVNGLVAFFKSILEEVSATVDNDVEDFLATIERGVQTFGDTNIISNINLRKPAQRRIRNTALQIQGSFSGIRDITGTYVAISDRYIQPAINKMEALSATKGDEWDAKSEEFVRWCRQSMREIEEITRAAADGLESNMTERVSYLQHAIESTA